MNLEKESIISCRISKRHKAALKEYCRNKGLTEQEYLLGVLNPYLDILLPVNKRKQSEKDQK